MDKNKFEKPNIDYLSLARQNEKINPDDSLLINILGNLNYPQSVKDMIIAKALRHMGATVKDKQKLEVAQFIAEEELMQFLASPFMSKIRSSSYEIFSLYKNRNESVSGTHLANYLRRADSLLRRMHEYASCYFNAEILNTGWPINPELSTRKVKLSVDQLLEKDFVSESNRNFHIRIEVPFNSLSYSKQHFLGDDTKIVLTINNQRQISSIAIYEKWLTSKVTTAKSYGNKKWRIGDENSIASPLILLGQNYPNNESDNPIYSYSGRGQDAIIKSGPLNITYHYHDGGSGWGEEIEVEKKYNENDGYGETFPLIKRYLELCKDFPRLADNGKS